MVTHLQWATTHVPMSTLCDSDAAQRYRGRVPLSIIRAKYSLCSLNPILEAVLKRGILLAMLDMLRDRGTYDF